MEIEPESVECFMLDLGRGASFSGNYEILSDDIDLEKVVITVEGPKRKIHYESKGLEEGSVSQSLISVTHISHSYQSISHITQSRSYFINLRGSQAGRQAGRQ